MNWSRGLFRLWMIASSLWVVGIVVSGAIAYQHPKLPMKTYLALAGWIHGNPAIGEVQAVAKQYSDLSDVDRIYLLESEAMRAAFLRDWTALSFPNNLTLLLPPTSIAADVQERAVVRFLAGIGRRSDEISAHKTKTIKETVIGAIWPPIVLLIVGASLAWAMNGFRPT